MSDSVDLGPGSQVHFKNVENGCGGAGWSRAYANIGLQVLDEKSRKWVSVDRVYPGEFYRIVTFEKNAQVDGDMHPLSDRRGFRAELDADKRARWRSFWDWFWLFVLCVVIMASFIAYRDFQWNG